MTIKQESWFFAACITVLMSIAFGYSLHNIGEGICIGIMMGVAFGAFESGKFADRKENNNGEENDDDEKH